MLCVLNYIDHAAVAPSCHPTCPAQSLLGPYLLHQLLLHVIVLPRQVLQLLSSFLHGPVGELGAILASLQQHVFGLQLLPHHLLFLHTITPSIIQSYPTITPSIIQSYPTITPSIIQSYPTITPSIIQSYPTITPLIIPTGALCHCLSCFQDAKCMQTVWLLSIRSR